MVFAVHDWGPGVGLSWALFNVDLMRELASMEPILRPPEFPPRPEPTGGLFATFHSPAGEEAVLENNAFVERNLIGGLEHYLSEADRMEYRRPYLEPGESRRPTLTWPWKLPMEGEPADTVPLPIRSRVVTTGVLLYDADASSRVEFETSTRRLYFDFRPLLERDAREALLSGG